MFGQRARAEQLLRELNADVYNAGFWAQFLSGLVAPATVFIGNLGYVGVAVIGGLQMATGHITLGGVQAFTQYVRQFNQPLTQAAGITDTLQSGIARPASGFSSCSMRRSKPLIPLDNCRQ